MKKLLTITLVLSLTVLSCQAFYINPYGKTQAQQEAEADRNNICALRYQCGNRTEARDAEIPQVYWGYRNRGYSPSSAYQATVVYFQGYRERLW